MKVDFFKHNLDAKDRQCVEDVLNSIFLTTGTVVDEFELLDEQEIITDSGRGLRTIYSFTPKGGENETVDQTALLANDRRSIYFFLVRCTTECFNESQAVVDEIVKSFTVKGRR